MKKSKLYMLLSLIIISILGLLLYGYYSLIYKTIEKTNIEVAVSYEDLYSMLKKNTQKNYRNWGLGAAFDGSIVKSAQKNDNIFSKTNVQVSGVDEADIIKTDGKYIYYLSNDYLNIVETDQDNINLVSKIKANYNDINSYSRYIDMYLIEDKLIVIKNSTKNIIYETKNRSAYYNNNETSAVIFDIKDKSNPSKINELSQSGNYVSSRLIDNYLYLTTDYYVYDNLIKKDIKTYVPIVRDKEVKPLGVEDIYIMPNPTNSYITITGIDINNPSKHISSKAVLGNSDNIYADKENIYVVGTNYNDFLDNSNSKSNIIKFNIDKGKISLKATGSVKGTILNQFSMDKYNGYFRIVTTFYDYNRFFIDDILRPSDEETTKNNLYILDENLNQVSSIEGLAKGERIYSVRFDGDMGYFVTFKQVDPLFVVDLSNPKEPKIKTELKIPGFSEYLHVYDDKYLFGLGKDADEKGRVQSMKISMFDITDKNNVIEKFKTKIGDSHSWSEASYNHKAIIISKEKDIIAFPINNKYVVYRFVDNDGFKLLKEIDFNYRYYYNFRGVYINDYLYVVNDQIIKTLNLNTLEEGKTLEFEEINKDKPLY